MFSRSVPSLRSASRLAARPIARQAVSSRYYSAEPEKTETSTAESEKIKALETKVADLEKERKYKQAEIQTLQRRIEEERKKASEFAITKFAKSLLETSDVLSTALSHVPKPVEPNTSLSSLVSGVEMTQKAMWKTFEQNGVVKMNIQKGATFNPNDHEATFSIPKEGAPAKSDGTPYGPGEVMDVIQEGWMIGNRVLREAKVGVTNIE